MNFPESHGYSIIKFYSRSLYRAFTKVHLYMGASKFWRAQKIMIMLDLVILLALYNGFCGSC